MLGTSFYGKDELNKRAKYTVSFVGSRDLERMHAYVLDKEFDVNARFIEVYIQTSGFSAGGASSACYEPRLVNTSYIDLIKCYKK